MENTNLKNNVEDEVKVVKIAPNKPVDFDIDLSATRKKRIRIDGDDSRIIELNTSDMDIIQRLNNLTSRINELGSKFANTKFDDELNERETTTELEKVFSELDIEMRVIVDELFQSKVADICAPDGTMWDMFNGYFRYEIIIEQLTNLYGENIQNETKKVMERLHKYTDKYMPRDHMKKGK